MFESVSFTLTKDEFNRLNSLCPNMRNNQDIGNYGEHVAKLYLESMGATNVKMNISKIDIQATVNGKSIKYEVKSTVDHTIAFDKLKVSSPKDHRLIVEGEMEILRICKIGHQSLDIYFLKYGRDFTLV